MWGNRRLKNTSLTFFIYAFALISTSYAGSDYKMTDTARLHSMVLDNAYELEGGRNGPFMVIDARTKEEYDEAHVLSAINIPEKNFEKSTSLLPTDKGALMVVYCNSMESGTCREWAYKAKNTGYTNILIYSEGFQFWKGKNMPVAPL